MSLLDSGATARVTEIAAKSLANLGSAPNNRTGIRLAGGIPPLVALLVEQPTPQVSFLVLCSGHPSMDASIDSTWPMAGGFAHPLVSQEQICAGSLLL